MSDPNLDYDPIQATVFQALCLAPGAHNALEQLTDFWADRSDADAARRLAAQIAQEKIFTARDLDVLECVLMPLSQTVDHGWRTEVVTDQYDMGRGHPKPYSHSQRAKNFSAQSGRSWNCAAPFDTPAPTPIRTIRPTLRWPNMCEACLSEA